MKYNCKSMWVYNSTTHELSCGKIMKMIVVLDLHLYSSKWVVLDFLLKIFEKKKGKKKKKEKKRKEKK